MLWQDDPQLDDPHGGEWATRSVHALEASSADVHEIRWSRFARVGVDLRPTYVWSDWTPAHVAQR